jgi:hypothetical protein
MASSWERLYTSTAGAGGLYEFDTGVSGITAKEHLKVVIHIVKNSTNENTIAIRFNGDSTANQYPIRRATDGAGDSTLTNYTYLYQGYGGTNVDRFLVMNIINIAGKEKLVRMEQTLSSNSRTEIAGKWVTTAGQITDIQCHGISSFDTTYVPFGEGSSMTIYGADDDVLSYTYPNIPNGAIFEESDTGKHYMFDGSQTWNEM